MDGHLFNTCLHVRLRKGGTLNGVLQSKNSQGVDKVRRSEILPAKSKLFVYETRSR
jgi:hypothetical protein